MPTALWQAAPLGEGELRAVCVSPVAAEPRAGLGPFLTVSAAGAGRVALLNPAVAT